MILHSDKNGIIMQPVTLQIRVPFQFLTNQRAIKCTHYSEPRDGLMAAAVSQLCVRQGSRPLDSSLGLVRPAQTLYG